MGIDFGGNDARMAQHFLHCSKIGTALYEMGGKRVSECMGTDAFFDSCFKGQGFDEFEHRYSGQACAAWIEKDIIFIATLDGNMDSDLVEINLYEFKCSISYGYKPFFIPFAGNLDEFIFGMHI
jgi:hypothetical protein